MNILYSELPTFSAYKNKTYRTRTVRSPTISLEITHKQNGTKTFKTVSGFFRVGTVIDFLFYIQTKRSTAQNQGCQFEKFVQGHY